MQHIKAIIFDFGGVIFNIDYNKTNKAFTDLGVKNFDDMYSQQTADPLFSSLERGKLNEEEFYHAFRKSSNCKLKNHQIAKAWNAMLLGYRKDALETLMHIKPKYKLYLLSNTNIIHHKAFNKIFHTTVSESSFDDYFDKAYYSYQVGMRKPDKEIYECIIKENTLEPSQTLFIDDSIQNIETAVALGFKTIFLKPGMTIENAEL